MRDKTFFMAVLLDGGHLRNWGGVRGAWTGRPYSFRENIARAAYLGREPKCFMDDEYDTLRGIFR